MADCRCPKPHFARGAGTSFLVCPVQVVDPTWVRVFLYVPKRVLADSWFGIAATI